MSELYQGDTITLRCEFREVAEDGVSPGDLYDPGNVQVRVYDTTRRPLAVQPAASSIVRESLGVYSVAYTVPMGQAAITHEWTGTDGQGHPVRAAATIEDIQWAR